MNNDPVLADMQERLFILAKVALPLIASNIDRLNINELEMIHDAILDFGYIAIKLEEIEMLEEALTEGESE